MKLSQLLLTILIAILASLGTYYVMPAKSAARQESKTESTYGRVMRTKTLRCGYAVYSPYLIKDANTGKLSGIYYDYIEALGRALNLKIDWAEEVGYGDMLAALEANRFDAFCNFTWPTAPRAKVIDYSQPIFYDKIIVLARADDARFDNDLSTLNNPSVTIAVWEGTTPEHLAHTDFPQAKLLATPQSADVTQQFLNVIDHKADVVITAAVPAMEFMKHNPNKLQIVKSGQAYRIYGNSFVFARGQDEFRRMIDIATMELQANGEIEKIMDKYEPNPGAFMRLNTGYKE
jgi:polar amino acid transport system substrate-binding protein